MTEPLAGIGVVDFSRVLAGPLVAMTLGDLGADVIKIESPLGDDTRRWKPPQDAQGRAAYHHTANRNKRSVALDLKNERDLELARRLCERADVVVSNFLPGTLQRFGLDYERIAAVNPGVVHCEISGFGEGAGAALPGYDPLVQALSGLMSVTGPAGHAVEDRRRGHRRRGCALRDDRGAWPRCTRDATPAAVSASRSTCCTRASRCSRTSRRATWQAATCRSRSATCTRRSSRSRRIAQRTAS